jgi:serine/threonine protein kinase
MSVGDDAGDPLDHAQSRRLLDAARTAPPGVGEWVGPYELIAEIGRGGHSAVYRARQHEPVRRDLAVKILIDPAPSANVAARFARERALVARLRHPGIVPLIDAGEAGPPGAAVPWFAMPLVEGESADRWCDRHGASRAVRLRVIELAARAVAAAHALGIVHRDLKPGNILVAGSADDPQVHVIDFGVAKLLDPDLESGEALSTRVGGIVGTPEYMSPEQANLDSARIGPTSDVYALGLVGCVLLSGKLPADGPDGRTPLLAGRPMGERLRAAAEREVPAPSVLAGDRTLRGEIDWIIAKCCARAADARYPNAGALADDLARLREGQPIVAAPRDSGYQVSYALRRYRAQLIGAALALGAVIAALAVESSRQRARAEFETERTKRLSALLETARVQLVPLTGRTRGDVVDETKAIPLLEMMRAINLELLGADANETQKSTLNLARAYDRIDRMAEAEGLYRAMLAHALRNDRRQGDWAFLRFMLAGNLHRQEPPRIDEAWELLELAHAYWSAMPDPPFQYCNVLIERANVAGLRGQHADQLRFLHEALACVDAKSGAGSLRRREIRCFLGDYHRERGNLAEARAWYLQAADSAPPSSTDPSFQAWIDAWTGELLWIDREEARISGHPFPPESAARFDELIRRVEARDRGNRRLRHWGTPAAPSTP